MIVQIVKFKSRLSHAEVDATYEKRSPRYRALEGLIQKYDLRFSESGENGAVYLWRSREDLERFRQSDLGQTIRDAYEVEGDPSSEIAELVMALRPGAEEGSGDA